MSQVSDYERGYQLALRYLAHRQRSEEEVRALLEKKHQIAPESIEPILVRLKELSLVDDLRLARSWKNDRLAFKPESKYLLRRELIQKGISENIIEEALSAVDDRESALRLAQKRAQILKNLQYPEFYRRMSAFLARRGYGSEVINTTIKQIWPRFSKKSAEIKHKHEKV